MKKGIFDWCIIIVCFLLVSYPFYRQVQRSKVTKVRRYRTQPPIEQRTWNVAYRHIPDKSIAYAIYIESKAQNIDPVLTYMIVKKESMFNPYRLKREISLLDKFKKETWMNPIEHEMQATSIGLMQIIPGYHLQTCALESFADLLDAEKNIRCGLIVLKKCAKQMDLHTIKGLKKALTCYNGSVQYADSIINDFNSFVRDSEDLFSAVEYVDV